MKTGEGNSDNKIRSRRTFQKNSQKEHKPNVDNLTLSNEDHLQSYKKVSELMKHNNQDKPGDAPKHLFLVDWQKDE